MKAGRVCIILAGRRAGKKCVVIKANDEGAKKGRAYAHALVAGVERSPMRVHKKMSKKKMSRRSKVKPFVKYVNYNHILPTRFMVTGEFSQAGQELKQVVTEDKLANPDTRKQLKQQIRDIFNDRYNKPQEENEKQPAVDFFFKKLRF